MSTLSHFPPDSSVNPGSCWVNLATRPRGWTAVMKLTGIIARSLQADMQAELRDLERAVSDGTREAGRGLRTELRRKVASAGLGQRLANSWRDRHYPNQTLDAASLVYTKAPQIIRAFDARRVIRSKRGRFLAIPTENAPRKGIGRQADQPEHLPGAPLRAAPVRASTRVDPRSW